VNAVARNERVDRGVNLDAAHLDAGITSAILDRVLHHAETVVIEGKSFRMKDQIEPPN